MEQFLPNTQKHKLRGSKIILIMKQRNNRQID